MRTGGFHKSRMIQAVVVLAVVVPLCLVVPAPGQEKIVIQVKKNALVHHDVMYLKELADIQANGFVQQALEKLELGRSPRPGDLTQLNKQRIVTLIQSQRYLAPGQVTLAWPDQVYVKRASQTLDRQRIQQAVDQMLAARFSDRKYTVTGLKIRGLKTYPSGEIRLVPDAGNLVNRSGRLSVYLDVWINNEKQNRLAVSGTLEVLSQVVCAKKNLGRGEKISASDVVVTKKNLFDLDRGFVTRPEEIAGMLLRSDINKGEVVTMRMVEKAPVIRKGDVISLVAKKGSLVIVTAGISKEDGFLNAAISVENITSGQEVRGRVKSRSRVEVIY
jgi:flagellar basal body P-ring formation protein FlgA